MPPSLSSFFDFCRCRARSWRARRRRAERAGQPDGQGVASWRPPAARPAPPGPTCASSSRRSEGRLQGEGGRQLRHRDPARGQALPARLAPGGQRHGRHPHVKALKRALRGSSANANGGFSDDPDEDGAHHSLGDRIPVKRGMSGHDIRVLQDFLSRAGFKVGIDGEFGSTTEKAVKKFETGAEPPVDGIMDAADIDALRTLAGQDDPAAGNQPVAPRSWRPATPPRSAPTGSPSHPPARPTRSRRSSPRATRSPASPTSTAAGTASGTTRATTARARSPTRCTAPGCSTSRWPRATSRAGATRAPASG